MEETFRYAPQNVCSREFLITHDGDKILKVVTIGGCPGNIQAVDRLIVGLTADEVIAALEGIKCPGSRTRQTSCPDQLAQAMKALKASIGK
ncbi:MAG: TIGR03905 family TSCPD domain-containing protein [Bacilli bacterium]|jgi:uncharacterized protein (TIGR03905 family)|nr:TIGR03905 family TSCPD domain-containing protein [Bacilli bacterium]